MSPLTGNECNQDFNPLVERGCYTFNSPMLQYCIGLLARIRARRIHLHCQLSNSTSCLWSSKEYRPVKMFSLQQCLRARAIFSIYFYSLFMAIYYCLSILMTIKCMNFNSQKMPRWRNMQQRISGYFARINNGTREISFPRASPVLDLSRSPEVGPGRFRPRPGRAAHSLPWPQGMPARPSSGGFGQLCFPARQKALLSISGGPCGHQASPTFWYWHG